jgi:hypothetical protein
MQRPVPARRHDPSMQNFIYKDQGNPAERLKDEQTVERLARKGREALNSIVRNPPQPSSGEVDDVLDVLTHWRLDTGAVRDQVYCAPTPQERERWHAVWLLAEGWSAVQVAEALARDPHTIGEWLASFRQVGPTGLTFEHSGGSPSL